MNTVTDSTGIKYNEINGLFFRENTPLKVCEILAQTSKTRSRIILDYGDIETGQSWGETNDIRGTVGRSTGTIKIPLLIKTSRSYGGGAILDNCIIKIIDAKTKVVLYQHSSYKPYKANG